MIDEPEEQETEQGLPAMNARPTFAGIRKVWRRLRGKVPHFDPVKTKIEFQPISKAVKWTGGADGHITEECGRFCQLNSSASTPDWGQHSEIRPDGLFWGGTRFSSLELALENQAFAAWYENGGKEVVMAGKMVLTNPIYGEDEEPPLPPYNFFLHEHQNDMTPTEVRSYRAIGEVPKRFRKRGRNRPNE